MEKILNELRETNKLIKKMIDEINKNHKELINYSAAGLQTQRQIIKNLEEINANNK